MEVVIVDFANFIALNGHGMSAKYFILLAVFSEHKTSLPAIKANIHQTS